MTAALVVLDIGKAYRSYRSEFQRIATWFGLRVAPSEEKWVLRRVTFSLATGECIGIIGRNGAGKSTLLKCIAGVLRPSEGMVHVAGDVAAILELGLGFNAELSGRANAIHASGLMGRSQAVIEQTIAGIADFAEIGESFDRPLRTYSSGMQARLAFAVATAVRPAILIIDEALSVGDAYFQHKSFGRIRTFREQGTSLLFVSHDRSAVQAICDRALLLDSGSLLKDGTPEEVIDLYNAMLAENEKGTVRQEKLEDGKVQTTSGSGEAVVAEIGLYDRSGRPIELVNVGQDVELRIKVSTRAPIPRLVLGYAIKDRLGQYVYGTNTHHTKQAIEDARAGDEHSFHIRFPMNFGPGSYSISTALVSTDTHLVNNYEWRDLALLFHVANFDKPVFVGSAYVPPQIEIRVG
ncbi:MAG TPA: ABC transporter ATP-binding protein [Casimicrobiaceae bacterium]|nr:ABC transporter ATP-binding protein [Casimicrobiaceae bacterium]